MVIEDGFKHLLSWVNAIAYFCMRRMTAADLCFALPKQKTPPDH
jgi:hypothetical protein